MAQSEDASSGASDHNRQVTIYDIAKEAGVSPSTVSRALSKPGRLSAKTEFKVRQVAERLGYLMIDSVTKRPSVQSTGMIGAVVPDCRNPFYAGILHYLRDSLHTQGYDLLILESSSKHAASKQTIAKLTRLVDGLVFVSSTMSEPDLKRVVMVRPTVMINRSVTGISSVTSDPQHAIDSAVRHLYETGHRSIAYLTGNANTWSSETRRRLIRTAAYRYDLSVRTVRGFDITLNGGQQAFSQYLKRPTDAVFAYNDQLAIGFISAARHAGMRVPDDVSVIGFDNIDESAVQSVPLNTIDQHTQTLGQQAAKMLLNEIATETPHIVNFADSSEYIKRESVAASRRSTMRLGPYVNLKERDNDTVTLTMLSSQFNETISRIEAFMRAYPNIAIDPIEGHTQEQTNALYWERVTNNRSVPDVFNVERDKLPQFAAAGVLLDIGTPKVEEKWSKLYNDASWQSSHYAGRLYGLPGDAGQTVMFYRQDILRRYDLAVPATWEQFYEEGVKLHQRNPNRWMGIIDTTDVQHYLSFLRMAHGKPWTVTGTDSISFHLADPVIRKTVRFIQRCIDDGVLKAEPIWDGRYAAPADGTFATLIYANWFGKILASSYPASAGKWRVALPPSFGDPNDVCTAEIGGSVLTVSARISKKRQRAALQFAHWFQTNPESVDLRPLGGFSATRYFQDNPKILSTVDPYFNQRIYEVYVKSANLLNRDWDNLPFATRLSAAYHDSLVPSLVPGGGSLDVIDQWATRLPEYAKSQGFTVE